ncbi:hypothetical protein GGI23_000432 [Coemansia sp. RSA 2559]|nr:hypothetical protein GGI23_000432 [Coemansia sp. RSA 2559]KAJ2869150.1 hypothetical protein GGI22_000423 [Coemansia erecta]
MTTTTTPPPQYDSSNDNSISSVESVTTHNHQYPPTSDPWTEEDTSTSISGSYVMPESTVFSSFVEEVTSDFGASSVVPNVTEDSENADIWSLGQENPGFTSSDGSSEKPFSFLSTSTDEPVSSIVAATTTTTTTTDTEQTTNSLTYPTNPPITPTITTFTLDTFFLEQSIDSPSESFDDSNNADSEPGSLTGFTTALEAHSSSLASSTTRGSGGGLLGNLVSDLLGPDPTTDIITQSEDPTTEDPEGSASSEPGSLTGFTTVLEAHSSSLSPSTTGDNGGGLLGNLVSDLLGPGSTADTITQSEDPTTEDPEGSADSDPNSLAEHTTVLENQSGDTKESGADGSTGVAGEETTTSDEQRVPDISWPEISWPEFSWPEISWPEISWPAISWPVDHTQTDSESNDGLSITEVPTESHDSHEMHTTETPFLPPWFETSDEESDIVSTAASTDTIVSDMFTSDDFSWGKISSKEEFTTGDTFSVKPSSTNELDETSVDVVESTDLVTSSWVSPAESKEETPTTSSSKETKTSTPVSTSTPTTTSTTSSSSTTTTKGVISVPTSVDFSRLTADPTETASASDLTDSNDSLPQVVTNPLSPTCSQCLTFTLRILAPYANLFGSNNYLASQAFNQIPNLVATALGININRATASMIFAEADAVVAANRRRSLLVRNTEPDYPHYYISLSITKDSSAVNPKSELQSLSTSLSSQVRDSSSELHTLNSWGSLIDRTYMVVTSNLDDLNGVAQVAPDSPGQVDSPLQSDSKSTSRSKWIGVGVGVSCAVVLGICILLVHYRRRHHMLSKRQIRQNFVAIQ